MEAWYFVLVVVLSLWENCRCEKCYLKRKSRRIKLKHVKIIGIDEIAIGHTETGKTAYWTSVRNMDSGAVLPVDQGKDGNVLRDFLFLMRRI